MSTWLRELRSTWWNSSQCDLHSAASRRSCLCSCSSELQIASAPPLEFCETRRCALVSNAEAASRTDLSLANRPAQARATRLRLSQASGSSLPANLLESSTTGRISLRTADTDSASSNKAPASEGPAPPGVSVHPASRRAWPTWRLPMESSFSLALAAPPLFSICKKPKQATVVSKTSAAASRSRCAGRWRRKAEPLSANSPPCF